MSRVFLDTNIFIYLIEDLGPLGIVAAELVSRLEARNDAIVTSAMTLGEILVKPIAESNLQRTSEYQTYFASGEVEIVAFDQSAALQYSHIRQDKSLKSPDAIQLACAAAAKCDLFVTNDERLSRKIIPGIQFITSLDRVPI